MSEVMRELVLMRSRWRWYAFASTMAPWRWCAPPRENYNGGARRRLRSQARSRSASDEQQLTCMSHAGEHSGSRGMQAFWLGALRRDLANQQSEMLIDRARCSPTGRDAHHRWGEMPTNRARCPHMEGIAVFLRVGTDQTAYVFLRSEVMYRIAGEVCAVLSIEGGRT